jgi:hypothetical protein
MLIPVRLHLPVPRLQFSDLVGPLQAPATEAERFARRATLGWQLLQLPFRLLFGVALAVALWNLISGVSSGDWSGFWNTPGFVVCMGLFMLFTAGFDPSLAHRMLHRGVHALRLAAARGDQAVAPVADRHPEPLDAQTARATGGEVVGPLRRADLAGAYMALLGGTFLAALGLIPAAFVLAFAPGMGPEVASVFGFISLALFVAGGLMLGWGLPRIQPLVVTADDTGLRWLAPSPLGFVRREVIVPWAEIRSLLLLRDSTAYYLVENPRASLLWLPPGPLAGMPAGPTGRLCSLVVTNAHVQLRDLSMAAKALVEHPAEGSETLAEYALRLDVANSGIMAPSAQRLLQQPVRQLVSPRLLFLGTIAVVSGLYAVGWVLQHLL